MFDKLSSLLKNSSGSELCRFNRALEAIRGLLGQLEPGDFNDPSDRNEGIDCVVKVLQSFKDK